METNAKNRTESQCRAKRKKQEDKDSHPLIKMELPPADLRMDSTAEVNAKTEKEKKKSTLVVPLAVSNGMEVLTSRTR